MRNEHWYEKSTKYLDVLNNGRGVLEEFRHRFIEVYDESGVSIGEIEEFERNLNRIKWLLRVCFSMTEEFPAMYSNFPTIRVLDEHLRIMKNCLDRKEGCLLKNSLSNCDINNGYCDLENESMCKHCIEN